MANQTLIAIPAKFDNFFQVRTVLLKLVENLDIVLGFRGSDSYASVNALGVVQAQIQQQLTTLNQLISQEVMAQIDANQQIVTDSLEEITVRLDDIQAATPVTALTYVAPAISAAYVQAEVQAIANNLQIVATKVNQILTVLVAAEITA